MDFRVVAKQDKLLIDEYFHRCYYENSHFTFINLFMWRKPFEIQLTVEDGVLYVVSRWQGEVQALQPFCETEKLEEAIRRQVKWFTDNGIMFKIVDADKASAEAYKKYDAAFCVTSNRDDSDYLYNAGELASLSGRKYHAKKNHVNSFWREYPAAEYLTLDSKLAVDCSIFAKKWAQRHITEYPSDSLVLSEAESICEIFADYDYYGVRGAAIRADGEIAAFTFGEALNKDTAVIHVEKANPDFRGAYAAINQRFAEYEWRDMKYINREEDMGLEGLRKAKESYKPVRMIEKFMITKP